MVGGLLLVVGVYVFQRSRLRSASAIGVIPG